MRKNILILNLIIIILTFPQFALKAESDTQYVPPSGENYGNEDGKSGENAQAETYYVAMNGSDNNLGTESEPFRTVQKGIISAGAGDIVYIKCGKYNLSGFSKNISYPLLLIGEDKDSTILNNGGALILSNSTTIKNLTFKNYDYGIPVIMLLSESGQRLEGVYIENCRFEEVSIAIKGAESSSGEVTNINISYCDFLNMNCTKVAGISILNGFISNINITNNVFKDLHSNRKSCCAVSIGNNAAKTTSRDILISGNFMSNITAQGSGGLGWGPEVHGIIAYGTNIKILNNMVKNVNNPNCDRDYEAIYIKANNSTIANNVVEDCASGAGGADITAKGGTYSGSNLFSGNSIIGNQPGRATLINGSAIFENNYIKKPEGLNGIDIYAFQNPVIVKGNYVEIKHTAVYLHDAQGNVISGNSLISYEGSTMKLKSSNGIEVSGNMEIKGFPGGAAPVAQVSVDQACGNTPLTVNFFSSGSEDPDGSILEYMWKFADGSISTDLNPTHTYTEPGGYPVTLMVTDNDGLRDLSSTFIIVKPISHPFLQ
jgi:PKD repeat protein